MDTLDIESIINAVSAFTTQSAIDFNANAIKL